MTFCISASVTASVPLVASSRTRMPPLSRASLSRLHFRTSATASANSLCSPWDREVDVNSASSPPRDVTRERRLVFSNAESKIESVDRQVGSRLKRIDPGSKKGSWGMAMIRDRSTSSGTVEMSIQSIAIVPLWVSMSRRRAETSVLFPLVSMSV